MVCQNKIIFVIVFLIKAERTQIYFKYTNTQSIFFYLKFYIIQIIEISSLTFQNTFIFNKHRRNKKAVLASCTENLKTFQTK